MMMMIIIISLLHSLFSQTTFRLTWGHHGGEPSPLNSHTISKASSFILIQLNESSGSRCISSAEQHVHLITIALNALAVTAHSNSRFSKGTSSFQFLGLTFCWYFSFPQFVPHVPPTSLSSINIIPMLIKDIPLCYTTITLCSYSLTQQFYYYVLY